MACGAKHFFLFDQDLGAGHEMEGMSIIADLMRTDSMTDVYCGLLS
jgi:hypothetical protein